MSIIGGLLFFWVVGAIIRIYYIALSEILHDEITDAQVLLLALCWPITVIVAPAIYLLKKWRRK